VEGIQLLAQAEGIFTETAGGVTVAAAKKLIKQGKIGKNGSLVIAITGNGLKTQEAIQGALGQALEIEPHLKSFEEKVLAEARR
jgi:threonine synthase